MKKKILWFPILSLQDKNTLLFNLEADQHFQLILGIQELLKKDFDVTFVLPHSYSTTSVEKTIIDYGNIGYENIIFHKFVPSNLGQRYDFDYAFYNYLLLEKKPDIIFNWCDCLSRNFKTIIEMNNLKTKIITFYVFIDVPGLNLVPIDYSYFIRQVDSALVSDAIYFMTELNEKTFCKNAERFNTVICNSHVAEFSFSQKRLDEQSKGLKPIPHEKKWIVFPNRLSSNNYSRHIEFIKAINSLYSRRQDFEVIMTNPTKYMSDNKLEKIVKSIVFPYGKISLDRRQYLNLLLSSEYCCALFKELHGGFAIREAIYFGCIPIVPMINDYAKFHHLYDGLKGFWAYIDQDLINIVDVMSFWLDRIISKSELDSARKNLIDVSSIEANYKNMKKTIMELL